MPNDISTYTTKYLVENAGESTSDFTEAQICNELKLRIVAYDYPVTEMQGGIHPHRPQ